MIKNVIFDVGGVLVNFRPLEYMADLGLTKDQIKRFEAAFFQTGLWHRWDMGDPDETIIARMYQMLPDDGEGVTKFVGRLSEIVTCFSYAGDWLKGLREEGYKVYLLSNYPASLFLLHARNRFNFMDQIDGKIVSGFVKLCKPDEAIYQTLFKTYSLIPEECVFLDDVAENIDTALRLGMKGILVRNHDQAQNGLRALLDRQREEKENQ